MSLHIHSFLKKTATEKTLLGVILISGINLEYLLSINNTHCMSVK